MTFNSFQDLFTRDEIHLLGDVRETGITHMFPILLRAPNQFSSCSLSNGTEEETATLRPYYAMQVWAAAYAKVSEKYASYQRPLDNYVWENWNESFRIIRFTHPKHKEIISDFWKELERIANSGEIKVSEGRSYRMNKTNAWQMEEDKRNKRFGCYTTIQIVVDAPDVMQAKKKIKEHRDSKENMGKSPATSSFLSKLRSQMSNMFSSSPPDAVKEISEKTYSWNEIKTLFAELPEKLISCLDESRMNRYEETDAPLFKACAELDIEGVKKAIANGANVNALVDEGSSALRWCCEAIESLACAEMREAAPEDELEDETPEMDAILDKYTERAFDIISYLLEKGAKIDLSGCDEDNPLEHSRYFPNTKLMRFLLEHGANPNVNCSLAFYRADWYTASSVLNRVQFNLSYDPDADDDLMTEMERLLLEYGARCVIDGFDVATESKSDDYEDITAKLPPWFLQRISKFSELDKRIYIASAGVFVVDLLDALSAGANINFRDKEGRSLLVVAIQFGYEIGFEMRKREYKEPLSCAQASYNKNFEEMLLTFVIALFGQKIQLTENDMTHAISLSKWRGVPSVTPWLVEKQTRLFADSAVLAAHPTTI